MYPKRIIGKNKCRNEKRGREILTVANNVGSSAEHIKTLLCPTLKFLSSFPFPCLFDLRFQTSEAISISLCSVYSYSQNPQKEKENSTLSSPPMIPFASTTSSQIRYLLQSLKDANSDSVFQELCQVIYLLSIYLSLYVYQYVCVCEWILGIHVNEPLTEFLISCGICTLLKIVALGSLIIV